MKFYILSYDATYINSRELEDLLKELRRNFPRDKFYTIVHHNHQKIPIYLLSSESPDATEVTCQIPIKTGK